MIELNMRFNNSGLFYKEPLYMCLSSICITMITKNLKLLDGGPIWKGHGFYRHIITVSDDISFYCKCNYAGKYHKNSGRESYEEKDFSEEISFNFPNHADTIKSWEKVVTDERNKNL